jgi:cytidyltransferase-like protein
MTPVFVSGGFDDLRSRHVRFLQEASRLGELQVLLWSDEAVEALTGTAPRLSQEERLYFLESIRYVSRVSLAAAGVEPDALPLPVMAAPGTWAVEQADDSAGKREFCAARGLAYRLFTPPDLAGFPDDCPAAETRTPRPKVIVTGCYDWLHTGHIRFFEEASGLGELYVTVGHDQNLRLLKGDPHPMFPEEERRYMVQAIRYVHRALISSGHGWMDAEPEIARIRPDLYVVNEDGDRAEKRAFCERHGLRYVVLKRLPKQGLQPRDSTALRGF